MAVSRSADAAWRGQGRSRRWPGGLFAALLAGAAPSAPHAASHAPGSDQGYWLSFGKPARLCPRDRELTPAKIVGEAWNILASGVVLCRDDGQNYTLSVEYLNVRVDPTGGGTLRPDTARFDWLGLALYRPDPQGATEWLFDAAHPLRGELSRDSAGRIVFGRITFRVPKDRAEQATNMLFYLTFGTRLVAINVL
jgi:hypothetical protein